MTQAEHRGNGLATLPVDARCRAKGRSAAGRREGSAECLGNRGRRFARELAPKPYDEPESENRPLQTS